LNKEQKKKRKEALEEKEYGATKEISVLIEKSKKCIRGLLHYVIASRLSIAIFFIRSSFTIKDNL
jgi:hypothetical protein